MKALSIKNPFAWQIVQGEKKVEYRSWLPGTVKKFLLVSSSTPSDTQFCLGLPNGYALAIVDIVSVPNKQQNGHYAWKVKLNNLIEPFPVKGKLHFYDVTDEKIHVQPEWTKSFQFFLRDIDDLL
jgi:hypothetical protein